MRAYRRPAGAERPPTLPTRASSSSIDLLERFVRLRAYQRTAVDVDRRRRVHAQLLTRLERGLDHCLMLAGVEALLERRAIQAELAGAVLQLRHGGRLRCSRTSRSCISQYLPWSPAQRAASAAFCAFGCVSIGKSL